MSNIIVIMPPEYTQYLYTEMPQELMLQSYKEMEMTGNGLTDLFANQLFMSIEIKNKSII